MSGASEWFRAKGLAVQVRAARERAWRCWLSLSFAQGLGGSVPPSVEDGLSTACDDVERLTLEWHAAAGGS